MTLTQEQARAIGFAQDAINRNGGSFGSIGEASEFINQVTRSVWWQSNHPNLEISLTSGGDRDFAFTTAPANGFALMSLPVWAWRRSSVLHELAHVLSPEDREHGAHFTAHFRELIEQFLGSEFLLAFDLAYKEVKL